MLVATLQPDAADTSVGGVALTTSLMLTPATSVGAAWQAAVADSAHAAPGLGIVALPQRTTAHVANPVVGRVAFGLPFPLVNGQVVTLSAGNIDPAALGLTLAEAPATSAGAPFEIDSCSAPPGSTTLTCAPGAGQAVSGTITVSSAQPLGVRIDATVTQPGDAPESTTVSADLAFKVQTSCSSWTSGVRID